MQIRNCNTRSCYYKTLTHIHIINHITPVLFTIVINIIINTVFAYYNMLYYISKIQRTITYDMLQS